MVSSRRPARIRQETALDEEHYRGLAGFRFALRQFISASERISWEAGVTQQQYQAMLAIKTWPYEFMSMKDLAGQLLLTHHATVQLVNRLSKLDLARREPSLKDRRSVLLRLTQNGEGLLDQLAAAHLAEMRRQEPMLTSSLRRLKQMGP
jgi:DNA-binding MarR family transcriptional regulator